MEQGGVGLFTTSPEEADELIGAGTLIGLDGKATVAPTTHTVLGASTKDRASLGWNCRNKLPDVRPAAAGRNQKSDFKSQTVPEGTRSLCI